MNNYTIWLTTDCNLRCRYCYEGHNKNHIALSQKMAHQVVRFIWESFSSENEELCIDFHGGEPLLNFNILRIFVENLKECFPDKRKNYSITTNATLLNDERINYLADNIKNISVSIDGSKEKHDKYRIFADGKGSYDIAIANSLKLLCRLQERLRVRMTFRPDTVAGLADDLKQLHALGFKTIAALPDIFNHDWKKQHFEMLKQEIEIVKRNIDDKNVYFNLIEPLVVQKKGKCTGGLNEVDIYPDGRLYPCTMAAGISMFEIGNIFRGIDVEKRDEILAHSEGKIDTCADCDMYSFCECIRCRIVNKLTMNSYVSPNIVQCLYNHKMIEVNGYLIR